ncbi:MAG: glycosyltransferase family 39 protein [Acidobacteriales bacterium]|nr:glycosyltransferase family 39 protein [Terriglobales bacterium]
MTRSFIVWTRLAQALALAILALNVYRAATCSITIDEAFTFNRFVGVPYTQTLRDFDANHHVLYALLARVSVGAFGVSAFTLRLPSLLGGALYLWVALALSRMLFGCRPMLVAAVGLLGLNPLVLDQMSLARGYGAGLACWLLALYLVAGWPPSPQPRQLRAAALALAASVGFNLIFVVPGLALAAWCAIETGREEGAWNNLLNHMLLPGVVGTFLILALPLAHAESHYFYLGEKTLWRSVGSLSHASLLQGMYWFPQRIKTWDASIWILADRLPWAAAVLFFLGIPAGIHTLLRTRRTETGRLGTALIATGWMALLMLVIGNKAVHALYPFARTGIYWIPLLTLLSLWLCKRYVTHTVARAAVSVAAWAWLALYLLQIHPAYYPPFRSDAGTKDFVEALRRMEDGSRKIRLGTNWQLVEGFNFYRHCYGLSWIARVERDSLEQPADYYALLPGDLPLIEKLKLKVLARDPLSEAVLARPAAVQSSP